MAIIQFQNGTKIQFNGTPTQQDIEEVAQKIGITQQMQTAEQPKKKGFFRQLGEDIVKPFAKAAATGVAAVRGVAGLGAYGIEKVFGGDNESDKQKILQTINQGDKGITAPLVGQVKPIAQGFKGMKESIGTGAEIGSYFIGGSGAPKTAISALKTIGSKAGLKALAPVARFGAKVGATAGGSQAFGSALQQEGATLGSIATQTALGTGLGTVAGAVTATALPIASGVIRVAGRTIKNIGEKIGTVAFEMEKPTAIAYQAYKASKPTLAQRIVDLVKGNQKSSLTKPTTEVETGIRQNLIGTEQGLGVQAKRAQTKIWDTIIEPVLEKSKIKVDMKNFFTEVRKQITNETPELNRKNGLIEALDSFIENYKNVGKVSLTKLQDYKSGWAKFLPQGAYQGKPISGLANDVKDMLASKAREVIYNTLDDDTLKIAYLDYGNLSSIAARGIKAVDALRDKGFFKQAWEGLLDIAVTPVASLGGNIIYKTGQGLEFIGGAGLKKVGDLFTSKSWMIPESSNKLFINK